MFRRKPFIAAIAALIFSLFARCSFAEYGQDNSASLSVPTIAEPDKQQSSAKEYEALYHKAYVTIRDHFLFQSNLTEWSSWEHKFDGQLTSLAKAEKSINQMADSANDPYTFFMNAEETKDKDVQDSRTGVVKFEMLPRNIGYVRISTFNSDKESKELYQALQQLQTADALIIDLRDNGGGLVDEAIHSAALFVRHGKFVTLKYLTSPSKTAEMPMVITENRYSDVRDGELTDEHEAAISKNIPIVILVDKETASAAEMFAGCLQENRRAKIVGTVTYGKGICQDLERLDFGTSLRYTYAFWLLPQSNKCIHQSGLIPDVLLSPDEMTNARDTAIKLLRTNHGKSK